MNKPFLGSMLAIFTIGAIQANDIINEPFEHKISFNPFYIAYEHIEPDSVYAGASVKLTPILNLDKKRSNTATFLINTEIGGGYNFKIDQKNTLTPYGAFGCSVFKRPERFLYLKNWTYGVIGAKYLHKFNDTFETGLHAKAIFSINERYKYTYYVDSFEERSSKVFCEIGIPVIFHVGENKNWEIQLEPAYTQTPQNERTHYFTSTISFGYRL